ncbi:unnamed protein product [Moneuplotes crassus]|uniref:C2 domain-containing protein n=2 Tax=Euplotes crassus TaxID=5936 RepID=A0AAD1UGE1_EUPCR|nr:unnamed protein product [Moneuplotes crassus]
MSGFEFEHPRAGRANRVSASSGYVDQANRSSETKRGDTFVKKQRLLEEFGASEGFQAQDMLSKEQVKSILDDQLRKHGKSFDEELIDAIFSDKTSISRDIYGRISKRDLCDAYIEIESYFGENIGKCNYKINELKKIKSEYEAQLRETSKIEVANQYGIMENSVLTITILEAKYIKLSDYDSQGDLYATVECGDQVFKTQHKEGMQAPIWEETVTFKISTGKEEIRVSVMDRSIMKQDSVVGVLYIPITTLSDQQEIEDWFNLEDPHGGYGESHGRIRLKLWWVYSKTKLIEDRIIQTDEDIEKIFNDKNYYADKVAKLREPFPWIDNTLQNQSSHSITRVPPANDYSLTSYKSEETEDEEMKTNPIVKVVNTVFPAERTVARGVDNTFDNFSQGVLGLRSTPWFRMMQWSAIIYNLLTLCSCFLRSDFVNLSTCVLICFSIAKIETSKRWQFRLIVYCLLASWVIDLIWIIMHTSPWWRRVRYDGDVELGMRRFVVIISFLSFLFRIFVLLIFWKFSLFHRKRMSI